MVLNIPEGFANVLFGFSGAGTVYPMACSFGIETDDSVEDIADSIANSIAVSDLDNIWHAGITLDTIRVKKGPNETGASGELSQTIPGTAGSPGASPNVSMLVRKSTALGGRKGRGRMFFPPAHEAAVGANGALDSGYLNGSNTVLSAWGANLITAGMPVVLFHNDATAPTAVTSLTMQTPVATQRRRQRR